MQVATLAAETMDLKIDAYDSVAVVGVYHGTASMDLGIHNTSGSTRDWIHNHSAGMAAHM